MKSNEEISLILSAVRALLGAITPVWRNVSVELTGNVIHIKCILDNIATEKDIEDASIVSTEIISDFPEYELEEIIETLDPLSEIQPHKHIIFQRKEVVK